MLRAMSRRAWVAFAAASLIWGVPYLFIRIAVRGGMTPLMLAWGRVTLGAVVLLVLAWRAGTLGQIRGHVRWLALYAVAEVTIPFPMIAFGELDPRAAIGGGLGIASLLLLPGAALDTPSRVPSAGAIVSVVVLGLLCTAAAFVILMVLIREAGTSRAMVITYVNPVVAVALGVALLGEQPGAGAVAGLLLILAGSWLSTGGRMPPVLRRFEFSRLRRPRPARRTRRETAVIGRRLGFGLLGYRRRGFGPLGYRRLGSGLFAFGRLRAVVPSLAVAATPAWTTYRHDMQRSGIDPDAGKPLTPQRV